MNSLNPSDFFFCTDKKVGSQLTVEEEFIKNCKILMLNQVNVNLARFLILFWRKNEKLHEKKNTNSSAMATKDTVLLFI